MDVLEAIKKRRSYRDVFKKEPVPREDLRESLEAGTARRGDRETSGGSGGYAGRSLSACGNSRKAV